MTEPGNTRPDQPAGSFRERTARPLARAIAAYGRPAVVTLALIVAGGFLARAWFVFSPDLHPGDDALAYRALAESLYHYGTYGGPGFANPSDWSPGAPLIYAASWFVTGGVRDGVARGVEALFGAGTIVIAFLLAAMVTGTESRDEGRAGRATGPLLAAFLVAAYPPFVAAPASLMSEPPAEFTLPAAVLAVLWADRRGDPRAWLLPGVLFGLTALIRPEYLFIAAAFAVYVLARTWSASGRGRAAAATLLFGVAALVPVLPWTVHNYVKLDRVVPVSTGSGKALFTGTYLPGDGEYQRVKAALLEQQTGRHLRPGSPALDRTDPVPLFDRVAARYPQLDRDAALGRVGRENLRHYLRTDPAGYVAMTARKAWRMWATAESGILASAIGSLLQKLLVLAGLAGLALLAWRRRPEAVVFAIPVAGITAIAALTLAPPRRNEILMTLLLPLVPVIFTALGPRIPVPGRPQVAPHPEKESLP